MTNGANFIIAKALVARIKKQVFGIPLKPFDELQEPYDSYFTDYSKNAKVSVDGKPTDSGLNILKGYPSANGLEAQSTSASKTDVSLDLGEVLPISRLRIVWGSENTTPQKWRMEVSTDGNNWEPWVNVEDNPTDSFDQWPGFEYYADKETRARFVKYTQPSGPDNISLKQISLFR